MAENRPGGREKHVTGMGKDVYKRGDGLGSGPVGSANGHAGRTGGDDHVLSRSHELDPCPGDRYLQVS